ncbi:amine oxidase [Alternaria alternata]|nr:amine oxidase [Alternaria alternata]
MLSTGALICTDPGSREPASAVAIADVPCLIFNACAPPGPSVLMLARPPADLT